jgi:hypothetical protein
LSDIRLADNFDSGGINLMQLHNVRTAVGAIVVLYAAAFAQAADTPYQVHYAANLAAGDSVVNISNSGASGAGLASGTTASTTGAICANVYAFTPDEQMVSCCSCPVTPNGLVSLSVKTDLVSNTLTPAVPTAVVIKLLATAPVGGSCNNSAAAVTTATLVPGMLAWGTTLHAAPAPVTTGTVAAAVINYSVSETPFSPATLSTAGTGANIGELSRLGQLCNFIIANGSGFGVCRSCRLGGLAAVKQ